MKKSFASKFENGERLQHKRWIPDPNQQWGWWIRIRVGNAWKSFRIRASFHSESKTKIKRY